MPSTVGYEKLSYLNNLLFVLLKKNPSDIGLRDFKFMNDELVVDADFFV